MVHNHQPYNRPLRRFVVLTNKNEYIVNGVDNIEAGYRAVNLAGLLDETLKDVIPCEDDDTRVVFTWSQHEEKA